LSNESEILDDDEKVVSEIVSLFSKGIE